MNEIAARPIDTVEELIAFVDLRGVHTYEVSGKRAEPAVEGDDVAVQEPMAIEIREQHDEGRIVGRFRATMTASGCDLVADVGAEYAFSEPLSLSRPAIEGFLEKVAVMAAWPFIRETIATTAARLQIPVPLLGLLKQGDFHVNPAGADLDDTTA